MRLAPELCGRCGWAREVSTARGSRFVRCGRSDVDPHYPRYPALPVRTCDGFEPGKPAMRVQRGGSQAAPPFLRAPLVDVSDGTPPTSRFDRIGGRPAVECVVDALYAHIASDAKIRALFPADLDAGRAKQRLFFEQWLGGEARYSARYGSPRLRQRHLPFPIDRAAAQHWLTHMAEALSECRVDAATAAEIMADLRPLALHMVNVASVHR